MPQQAAIRPTKGVLIKNIGTGLSTKQIAELYEVNPSTLHKWYEHYSMDKADRPCFRDKDIICGLATVKAMPTPVGEEMKFALPGGGFVRGRDAGRRLAAIMDNMMVDKDKKTRFLTRRATHERC